MMDNFLLFRELIEDRCGLHFDESQRASLTASLNARMQQLGLARLEDYYDRLKDEAAGTAGESEFRHLINLVTITETCFFRDAPQFRMLRERIIPDLMRHHPKTVRIWSAGCSSGEEAYSIALTLWEMGAYLAYPECSFEIVGTDINTDVLAIARQGVYAPRALRNVSGSVLRRHFTEENGQFVLDAEIRNRVQFEQGNLTQKPMPTSGVQDVVFCKNVAIYFQADVSRKLMQGLRGSIADGGYLLLGHAESLWQGSEGFELVGYGGAYGYRKPEKGRVPFSLDLPEKGTRPLIDAAQPYEECLAAFRAGLWADAESGLRALLRSSPTFLPARLLLGGVYAHTGRYDEAAMEAESLLRLSKLDARAHLLLGMVAARQNRLEHAMQSLRRALYLDDSLALAHFWLGNLYRDRGDLVRACYEYENVVRDWEQHTLDLTEEFASDLTAEQLVGFCSDSLRRLRGQGATVGTWP